MLRLIRYFMMYFLISILLFKLQYVKIDTEKEIKKILIRL